MYFTMFLNKDDDDDSHPGQQGKGGGVGSRNTPSNIMLQSPE